MRAYEGRCFMFTIIGRTLAALFAAGIVFFTTANILGRYLLSMPIPDVEAFVAKLFIGLVYFGLADTLRSGKHVKIDVILSRLPESVRNPLDVGTAIVALAFVGLFFWNSIITVVRTFGIGTTTQALVTIPVFIPMALLSLGLGMLILELILYIYHKVYTPREINIR